MDDFYIWHGRLSDIAKMHGENVSDEDAWREEFEAGKSPDQAFYEEYPEHEK